MSNGIDVKVTRGGAPVTHSIDLCATCREPLGQQRYSAGREVVPDPERPGEWKVVKPGVVVCSPACAEPHNK